MNVIDVPICEESGEECQTCGGLGSTRESKPFIWGELVIRWVECPTCLGTGRVRAVEVGPGRV